MTIVVSVPEQSYTPQTATLNVTVGSGVSEVRATLTRVAWPAGAVGGVTVTRPDATLLGAFTFDGGVFVSPRDGLTRLTSVIELREPGGFTPGNYVVDVEVLQTLTTAITIEVMP